MFGSKLVLVTAGSRLRTYGGEGGSLEWRYELILWTKVDLPAPAMPMVMMTTGFFLSAAWAEDDELGAFSILQRSRG